MCMRPGSMFCLSDSCLTGKFHLIVYLLSQEIAFPKMVASCCRFLCYFCRISRQNQKAMFDHLSYLLENSSVGLGEFLNTRLRTHQCCNVYLKCLPELLHVRDSNFMKTLRYTSDFTKYNFTIYRIWHSIEVWYFCM